MSKVRGRPFEAGNTQGRGRPPGSRNKEKPPWLSLLEQYGEHLVRKCIAMAMNEDRSAMRLCIERILPVRQEAYLRIKLPPIRTAQDVETAAETVTQAVVRGKIAPTEGARVMGILAARAGIREKGQNEDRLEKVEEQADAARLLPGGSRRVP